MRIFFSHSSEKKYLVRALRACLPQHINAWIDEDHLLAGDSVERTLHGVLASKIDYVLLIVDQHAAQSKWVAREVAWTLEKEREVGRRILLPIVVERAAWDSAAFDPLRDRKYIDCPTSADSDVRAAAERVSSMLFSLMCRDYERLAHGDEHVAAADGAHAHAHSDCEDFAIKLREVAFRHRDYNPLALSELTAELHRRGALDIASEAKAANMVSHVLKEGLIPGLVFDGATIFVREEHYRWKAEMASKAKALIARCAARQIKTGDTVALDAGSTSEAVAKTICTLIANRALSDLKIVSNSVPAIKLLMETAVALGLDESNDLFELYVPSGLARPNTLSIAEAERDQRGSFAAMLRTLGGADIAIIGANGIDPNFGFTTHSPRTASYKRQILRNARKRFIVADSTKFGVHEDMSFASFKDEVTLITDRTAQALEFSRYFSSGRPAWLGGARAKLRFADDAAEPAIAA